MKIGYCFTGSFCTLERSLLVLSRLVSGGHSVTPIMSESVYYTDTRFTLAEEFSRRVEELTGNPVIHTVRDAEPLGPKNPLDFMIAAPCTGNTLAKLSRGITDTAATMAMKAHLRSDRPLLIALASNDALSQNLESISRLLNRKAVYFVPMRQDDPTAKPHSLVAEFEKIEECIALALSGRQMRPIFV
ncbi:MAG: dipicolinate synthase subunit B [Clostridia bacterium]|nr:dipicolinate synthase subunit B [Clostridia bacterium]